jgi:hypothetical protein
MILIPSPPRPPPLLRQVITARQDNTYWPASELTLNKLTRTWTKKILT